MENDVAELVERAETLRRRFVDFIDDLGEFAPPLRELRAHLAEIDEHLAALVIGRVTA